ncbi:MAG TPA: HEAT repeat domain-containing protein [Roseiflexaceae bacterium]|nr:HEAT repeat domain-containing protein [Roseiflexaceae bacterium]
MNESSEQQSSSLPDHQIASAVAVVRRSIPAGSNLAIVAALDTLAQLGDTAALAEIEDCLSSRSLAESYGDRDDDPPDWQLNPRAFTALVRWWQRLRLEMARGAQLAEAWLGERRHFGSNSYEFFTHTAPELAAYVAPPLIAALRDGDLERRRRAIDGLGHLPVAGALDALIASLDDREESIRNAARWALGRSARRPETAERLVAELAAASPLVRAGALQALAWFAGLAHRNSVVLPPLFEHAFPAIAQLLFDDAPAIRQLAAERIDAAGYHLDMLRPSRAKPLDHALAMPRLDLLPLLEHPNKLIVRAAIYLAGRAAATNAAQPAALASRITALLTPLRADYQSYKAALYALGRLAAVAAIPAIAPLLDDPKDAFYADAALVLGRLGYPPAIEHLTRLLADLTYRDDAREGLEALDSAVALARVNDWLSARRRTVSQYTDPNPAIVRYLEARGDAYSLALLRQAESYHFAARYAGAEGNALVAAARRLDRRLLAETGLAAQAIDDPLEAVRRILSSPLHPAECVTVDVRDVALPDSERRARWRNLCVALAGWLRAEPGPRLEEALDEAERLLADFPDQLCEAHESWWLDVVRGGQIGLPRVSAVARATLRPREPWRLARALVINEGLQHSLDPASCFAWPGLASIRILELPLDIGWLRALVAAPAHVAPRRLRVLLGGDAMAHVLVEWPGLERLDRLEVIWSNRLSDAGRTALARRVEVHYW